MKKTIALALLCLGAAATASAVTTYTTTNSSSATVANAWFNGFTLTLTPSDTSRLTTSIASGSTDTTAFSTLTQVSLDSITVSIRSLKGVSALGLALTDASGTVLALSDNTVNATATQTWTFTNTLVSTTASLYFVYYNAAPADEANVVKVGTTLTSDQMVTSGGSVMSDYSGTTAAASHTTLGVLGGASNKDMELNPQTFAPCLTITTSEVVPEPATATLSLLALAGLAARRRRK